MKKYKLLNIFYLFLSLTLLNSCGTPTKYFTTERNAIPSNFGSDQNCILICILEDRDSRDRYMVKQIKNEYHGKYEFVSESELNSSKYEDKNIYRYFLDYKHSSVSEISYNAGTNSHSSQSSGRSNYFIFDRKENKEYNNNVYGSFFSKLIKAYAINLEKVRLKNKKG